MNIQSGPKKCIHTLTWKILLYNRNYFIYTKAKLIWEISLNFGIILHSHPEIEVSFKFIPKILMSIECIHFFGPLCMCGLGVQGEGRGSAFLRTISKFIPGDTVSHRLEPQIWNVSAGLPKPNQNIKKFYLSLRIKVIYLSQQYVGTRTKLMELELEQGSYLWRKPYRKTE